MKKVRLAFYKAKWNSITDALIAGWTWIWTPFSKGYTHVEIGFEINGRWIYFSSTIRKFKDVDGKLRNGTRWIDGEELLKHPENWDIYEKEYPDNEVMEMIDRADDMLGRGYDILGILGFVTFTGLVLNFKKLWYCSEACWRSLTGQWKKRISPRRMGKRIMGYGFQKISIN